MKISLSPRRCDDTLSVIKFGDVLTINGEPFDFSGLPDGATIPDGSIPCEWIVSPVDRFGGEVQLTLILPCGPNPSQAVAFPAPIISPPDGAVALPFDPPTEPEESTNVDA